MSTNKFFFYASAYEKQSTTMAYPLPRFNMLNFRKQNAPKFLSTSKKNPVTQKQETYHSIENDAGYTYKVVTPPCEARYAHLSEGGNEGGMYSKTKQTSYITTQLLREGSDEQFKSERSDFFEWLAKINNDCLDQMYENDIGGATTAIRAKTQKRYGKNKTADELEAMSLKAFKKNANVPLKEKDGIQFLVTKVRAYSRDLSPREIRYVQPSGNKYVEMETVPTIYSGALVSTVFSISPYSMAKDKYGLTYKLIPDIVVYSTGNGRQSAPMEAIETPNRPYAMSLSEGKDGKKYLNFKDEENRKFEFRPVATSVVFGDSLTGTGTLGNIAGVDETSAKYTGVTKEDTNNPDCVAAFDYMSKMADDVVEFALNDDQLITKLKTSAKEEADEMAEESGRSVDECFKEIVKESFNSPISKRDQDDFRQLRFSQRVYSKTGTQNTLPMHNPAGEPVTESLNRGAKIAPVLAPSVYFMADGKFGLKFDISLQHGMRVDSNPEAVASGNGVLYAFEQAEGAGGSKRKADDMEEPSSKRVKVEA